MSSPSEALTELMRAMQPKPDTEPVTWGELKAVTEQAEQSQAQGEWERYMGDDL